MKRLCHCGAIVAQTPCENCREKQRGVSKNHAKRYDSKWRKLSERYRHDLIPISEAPDRRLDVKNLISLCHRCHQERHREHCLF